tara:strand:- start:26102 stop:26527 length:426 start_codon:yes stop_codon:yes gene_type:complete
MLKTIHSYWAYVALLILVIAVVNSLLAIAKKREFTDKDLRIGLFTLIANHIQLLIGFVVYFSGPYFELLTGKTSEVMKNSEVRKLALEHPLTMIIAIALITIGWSRHKKKTEGRAKFATFLVFYGLALVLVLAMIPWNVWF